MSKLTFEKAKREDLEQFVKLENEYFADYDRAFTVEDFAKWFDYNPEMFYVVKDEQGKVLADLLFVPVKEELYKRLRKGEVSDLYNFEKSDVIEKMDSPYYHLEQVVVTRSEGSRQFFMAAKAAVEGITEEIASLAQVVTTSPITKEGRSILRRFGFEKVANENYNGESYNILELVVTEEKIEKFSKKQKNNSEESLGRGRGL